MKAKKVKERKKQQQQNPANSLAKCFNDNQKQNDC